MSIFIFFGEKKEASYFWKFMQQAGNSIFFFLYGISLFLWAGDPFCIVWRPPKSMRPIWLWIQNLSGSQIGVKDLGLKRH